jgi:5'(3')-deoxyribonucleotidase
MNDKIIQFDVDGVLANFMAGFVELSHCFYKKRPELIASWDWDKGYLSFKERMEIWESINNSPSFWFTLPCLLNQAEKDALLLLAEKHTVYFVTNRQRKGIRVKQQTEDWLRCNVGIENPTVILTKFKGDTAKAIGADYAIDDKPENAWCMSWLSPDTKSYLLNKPYNQYNDASIGSHKITRVGSVGDFIRIVNEESEERI